MNRPTVALLILAAAGSAAAVAATERDDSDARLARALAGYTPGRPTSCIPFDLPTMNTQTYGKTILYRRGGGEIYRNDTAGGCEGAAHGDILVSVEYEGRPCSGDIVRTVDQSTRMPTGSCALGQFVPYTKVKAATP